MTQLAERLCLNLSDTLSCYVKFLTNFLKSSCLAIIKTKTKLDYITFSFCKRSHRFFKLFLQHGEGCGINW